MIASNAAMPLFAASSTHARERQPRHRPSVRLDPGFRAVTTAIDRREVLLPIDLASSAADELLLLAAAAAVPVLFDPGIGGAEAEAPQLWALAQAPLQLGEAGEAGQPDHVLPEAQDILVTQ